MINEIFINLSYFDMIFPNMPGPVPEPFVGINAPEWLWLMTNNNYIFIFFGRIWLQIFQINYLVDLATFFFSLLKNIILHTPNAVRILQTYERQMCLRPAFSGNHSKSDWKFMHAISFIFRKNGNIANCN